MTIGSEGLNAVAVQVKGEGVNLVEEHLAQQTEPVACGKVEPIAWVFEERGNLIK